jgi:hypothetical protein
VFVLRVRKDGQALQRFDTMPGAPLTELQDHTIMNPTAMSGIYDSNATATVSRMHVFCGLGVPPAAPLDLNDQANFLRMARPVGLLRLVLTERKPAREMQDNHVLFVSQLVRMYGSDWQQNYWISKCAWSLRNTPGFTNLQPWWIIYTPRIHLARLMWELGARTKTLASMEPSVTQSRSADWEKQDAKKRGKRPQPGLNYFDDFRDTIVLTNDGKGGAVYWQRKVSRLHGGQTDEAIEGSALPEAIRARVAPRPGMPKMETIDGASVPMAIPWNGQLFGRRYSDDAANAVSVPLLFTDGAPPEESAAPTADAASDGVTPLAMDNAASDGATPLAMDKDPLPGGLNISLDHLFG